MADDDWKESQGENVLEMYVAHGGPGFWIRRTTWGASCARIVRVGEITKPGPYFGKPSVLMDVYSLRGELRDEAAALLTAGTYKTWRKIDPPAWAETAELRPLDDPRLDEALLRLDKKRRKGQFAPPPPPADRVRLRLPYEKKDVAKGLGARWDPEERAWWLAVEHEKAINEAKALGFVPEPGSEPAPAPDKPKDEVAAPVERVRLNVPYEKKDVAKGLGARWDPAERFWWLPADRETAIDEAKALGFLPEPLKDD